MSAVEDRNKALVTRWFEEVWNQGRIERLADFRAPDAVATGLGNCESRGDAPFQAMYSNLRETLPDLHISIDDIMAEGDRVAVRITLEGTHTGAALGASPSGRKISVPALIIARIVDGKIAQAWNSIDRLSLLLQIGALPDGAVQDDFLIARP